MGLFSRKQEEKSLPPAPMPPSASIPTNMDRLNLAPGQVSKQAPFLSAPPVPSRNSLDEIKSQVISSSGQNNSNNNNIATSMNNNNNNNNHNSEEISSFGTEMNGNDDSLFDFSSLDISSPIENNVKNEFLVSNQPSISNERASTFVDTRVENQSNLSFVSGRSKFGKSEIQDNLYVTTSQFKTFLEIVEQVRSRVKDSSDRHLRLLDIKSEEDIEYENLRKDFQYIEDKLYEVDNLIFDK